MTASLTKQSVVFISSQGFFDEGTIRADSGIQTWEGFSQGGVILQEYITYYTYPGGVETGNNAFILSFIVSAANAATIVSGMPALVTRMATAQPQISNIVTWGIVLGYN